MIKKINCNLFHLDPFMPVEPKTFLTIFVISLQLVHFPKDILRDKVDENATNNSPSNSLQSYVVFASCFEMYHGCR